MRRVRTVTDKRSSMALLAGPGALRNEIALKLTSASRTASTCLWKAASRSVEAVVVVVLRVAIRKDVF